MCNSCTIYGCSDKALLLRFRKRAVVALLACLFIMGILVALCGCRDNKLLDVAIGDENQGDNRSDTATTTTNNDSNNEVAE